MRPVHDMAETTSMLLILTDGGRRLGGTPFLITVWRRGRLPALKQFQGVQIMLPISSAQTLRAEPLVAVQPVHGTHSNGTTLDT